MRARIPWALGFATRLFATLAMSGLQTMPGTPPRKRRGIGKIHPGRSSTIRKLARDRTLVNF